jgi:hypothetical protein
MKIFERLELFILNRIPNDYKTIALYEDIKFFTTFLIFIVLFFSVIAGIYNYVENKETASIHAVIKDCELVKVNIAERKSYYQCGKVEYIVNKIPSDFK